MYYLKTNDLEQLRKYGFKLGKEWNDYTRFICNEPEYEDFWLVSTDEDDPDEIFYSEYNIVHWYIHVQPVNFEDIEYKYRLWIDGAPASTYHIDNADMEEAYTAIFNMINDGLIVDVKV